METEIEYLMSWFFDFSKQPYEYGCTCWEYTKQCKEKNKPTTYISYLKQARVGIFEISQIQNLIDDTIADIDFNQSVKLLFDKIPELEFISKKSNRSNILLIKREFQETEQIMKIRSLINCEKYIIPSKYLAIPDLVFDEIDINNIIDPVYPNVKTTYPMTQSLVLYSEYTESKITSIAHKLSFLS